MDGRALWFPCYRKEGSEERVASDTSELLPDDTVTGEADRLADEGSGSETVTRGF